MPAHIASAPFRCSLSLIGGNRPLNLKSNQFQFSSPMPSIEKLIEICGQISPPITRDWYANSGAFTAPWRISLIFKWTSRRFNLKPSACQTVIAGIVRDLSIINILNQTFQYHLVGTKRLKFGTVFGIKLFECIPYRFVLLL